MIDAPAPFIRLGHYLPGMQRCFALRSPRRLLSTHDTASKLKLHQSARWLTTLGPGSQPYCSSFAPGHGDAPRDRAAAGAALAERPRRELRQPKQPRALLWSRQFAAAATSSSENSNPNAATAYSPPTAGFLPYLPPSWVPYAELARLDKPAGVYYLLFPCLFSTVFVSTYTGAAPIQMVSTAALFAAGAVIMRGAGCTVNDLWDRNLDPHVARTRFRPLARKAVSPVAALTFFGAQCLAGLVVLLQLPQPACLLWGAPSLLLVALYPLAKRVTYYPQVVLGFTFSWGALMGFPALGVDLLQDTTAAYAAGLLYASCISWTVLYDMIYAHMDISDDRKVGIKSIALRHEASTKSVLAGLAVVQTALLAGAGAVVGAGPLFYAGSCGGAVATLSYMIWKVKLRDPSSCWWWFRYGSWFTGGAISLGLLGEYISTQTGEHDEPEKVAAAIKSNGTLP